MRLVGILTVAANRDAPLDKSDTSVQQVKVVAEARNHLYLLLMATQIPKVMR